ncbi:S-DNA-T family DNA segregation ATPase FtsK/SpoIIIE [Kribbella sp. VKM Ac-2527]|uniref:S-DNA-T family DNA segregation ATPase FtsK/SpoIIIE n=1 Tax=Kribbella caucasensis TaxID=2512215 RepID=A0A4R6JJH1_9ACTN|nr:FtsK/SpoIIIE domain-containing protein [Kribbella sp. VKM Ac-2527]TDO35882.1 S-DNA-T family DNA segregation ATPase FtsK/SpoIIIE [Kribbella sp. VKM Ac-2527]
MDNVHKLHDDSREDAHETVQDSVHENLQDEVQDIVHEDAERVPAEDVHGAAEVQVIEGEILTDEESADLDRRLANRGALVRRAVTTGQVATRAVVKVSTHDRTKTVGKVVLRESFTVVQGVESWAKRLWDASTMGVYRRQIKAAEAAGDREELKEWADRKEMATERRHRRLMDLPKLFVGVVKVFAALVLGVPLAVFVIAVLTKATGNGSFTGVWLGFFGLIGFVIAAVAFVWGLFTIAAPFLLVLAAWREGKRRAEPPSWLVTTGDQAWDVAIDETTIASALNALRIPSITQYLKSGLKLQFITPARVDGRGTHAVVRLPAGVTAEKIARRRAELATGLSRAAKEVWPTTGSEAGILDLWVADKGALAEGAGEYPLLEGGLVDFFKGVPAGRTLRGDPMLAPMAERNTITGGIPGQGKSASARVMMIGAALDPTAELRIWVPDTNYDFEVFRPRCSRYVMGSDAEAIEKIRDDLKELYDEVQARGALLVKYEIPSVTREIANKGVGLHPLVGLLEEAHVALYDDTYGKEIQKYVIEIVKLGRKRGIHLVVSTQAPTATSMPRDVTRNCSNGIAFAVSDHVANDALLGQGAYTAGHRATELIPGTDRGTSIVKGFSGERSEILQWYFLDVSRENDQVTPLIERAMAAIAERGGSKPGTARIEIETRDLLADLDEVLGDDPVPSADVPALLKRLAPTWAPYQGMTGKSLRDELARGHGVKVPSTGNRWPVDPATIRDAIVRREQDTDEADDGTGQLAS